MSTIDRNNSSAPVVYPHPGYDPVPKIKPAVEPVDHAGESDDLSADELAHMMQLRINELGRGTFADVERAARCMHVCVMMAQESLRPWEHFPQSHHERMRDAAKDVIRCYLFDPDTDTPRSCNAVPGGMKLVPVAPTEAQIRAGWDVDASERQRNAAVVYAAMVNAAPNQSELCSAMTDCRDG
jgi:hypothetical protein